MPNAVPTFQLLAQPRENPFADYLRPVAPRPIDTQPPTQFTGYESDGAAAGDIALEFLKGVRQNRVADFTEREARNEEGLQRFREHVNARLADPDLTEEGRQKIRDQADQILTRHMHYELRDAPKDGIGGFFKNLLINASGGPIKERQPINWEEATGQIAHAAAGYSQNAVFRSALARARQKLQQADPMATPDERFSLIQDELADVTARAPSKAEAFQALLSPVINVDPAAKHEAKFRAGLLSRINARHQAAPPTAPPPAAEEVSAQTIGEQYLPLVIPPAPAVATAAAPEPVAEPVENSAAASWLTPDQQQALDLIRELQPYAVAAPGLVEKYIGKPTMSNLQDPAGGPGIGGVIRYPGLPLWLDSVTLEPIDRAKQSWLATTGASAPSQKEEWVYVQDVDNPKADPVPVLLRRSGEAGTYEPVPVQGQQAIDLSRYRIVGPIMPMVPTGSSATYGLPYQAFGQTAPGPRETATTIEEHRLTQAGEAVAGEARRLYPNDPVAQHKWIAAQEPPPNVDKKRWNIIIQRAAENAQRQPSGGEDGKTKAINILLSGQPPAAAASATAPTPGGNPQSSVPAPAAAPGDRAAKVNNFKRQ